MSRLSIIRVSTFLSTLLFLVIIQSLNSSLLGEETTRYGATLIRAELADANEASSNLPEISFSDEDQKKGWKLVPGDAYTGIDAHRFYFTIEAVGAKLPAPTVEINWPNVQVSKVLGAPNYETTAQGVKFTPSATRVPTSAFTEMSFGSVYLGLFHNWEVRRCGPYRDVEYPENEIRAQLNYMLGTLEVCRAWGWTETTKPDFVDHINIYGFETHFPNGHRDFPSHFHIMLAWDGWAAAHVGHYLLNPDGTILKNTFWSLHKDVERFDRPSVVTPYRDKTDRVVFETEILEDGTGLVLRRSEDNVEYLVRAGQNGAAESTEVCKRDRADNAAWAVLCEVQATDNAAAGVFTSVAQYADGTTQTVSLHYDPDTGKKLD